MSAPEAGPAGEPLAGAARLYLALLPVGHLVVVPLGGTAGTAAALARGGLLAAGVVAKGAARLGVAQRARAPVLRVAVGRGLALLAAFGVWAALSGVWGYHPRYAAFKGRRVRGPGHGRLAAGAERSQVAPARGDLAGGVRRRARAARDRGARAGRTRRSGAVRRRCAARIPGAARVLAAVGAFVLALMVSTGWVAAGVAAIVIGRAPALAERPRAARALRLGGAAPAAGALVGVLVPLKLEVAGRTVRTAAVRPAIWGSALTAVATSPLIGVGAAPFLATAPDPWGWAGASPLGRAPGVPERGGAVRHRVGGALMGAGIALVVRALLGAPASRRRAATLAVLAGIAAHGFLVANEDFRHAWALLELAGAVASEDDGESGP